MPCDHTAEDDRIVELTEKLATALDLDDIDDEQLKAEKGDEKDDVLMEE